MTPPKPQATPTERYRWASPGAWLLAQVNAQNDRNELRSIIRELLGHVDSDQVQESFQAEMDADGYFLDLNKCPDCESDLTRRTEQGGHPSYCDVCDREVDLS